MGDILQVSDAGLVSVFNCKIIVALLGGAVFQEYGSVASQVKLTQEVVVNHLMPRVLDDACRLLC